MNIGNSISVDEAREVLGSVANTMSDKDIKEVINTLDLMAKDSLEEARKRLEMKRDARDLANLIYDIYQDKKVFEKPKQ